jgi:hypothetical protein
MTDDGLANGPKRRLRPKKNTLRTGKGRGRPWARPSEQEKRAAALLAHPPLRPVRR